jgi:hypothetical protein
MPARTAHQREIEGFLKSQMLFRTCTLTLPQGTGKETYIARSDAKDYFVKLNVDLARYEAVASCGLTPQVITRGILDDGTTVLVQPYIKGKSPTRKDYRLYLCTFATMIHLLHHDETIKHLLPAVIDESYRSAGLAVLDKINAKWFALRGLVPDSIAFIEESLEYLREQISGFSGSGLVASHNDICNANWLLSEDDQLYLIDLDSMSLDDPALDLGATLWWYYPPELRPKFLKATGYLNDAQFQNRMRIRMAIHCLNIVLPRPNSYDQFDPASFGENLVDFRAALAGEENPQGYD